MGAMHLRHYRPGDEHAQAAVFNAAAASLPAFKPATAEEIVRRYRSADPDPTTKVYAVEEDRIVGYAVFSGSGRISYPWCLPNNEQARVPLLEAVLSGLRARGRQRAWAAYRGDWRPVLAFLMEHGFSKTREMVNYVAEVERLPRRRHLEGQAIASFTRPDVEALRGLSTMFADESTDLLGQFFFENLYFRPSSLYTLKDQHGLLLGLGITIVDSRYADPTKLDAAMPCFRLGALGTENERHKRVNGMFSCVFGSEAAAEALLAEAAGRLAQSGLSHVAAQAPSDQPELCAFYDRYFQRQGAFPILTRQL
jgi:hypothetical protein